MSTTNHRNTAAAALPGDPAEAPSPLSEAVEASNRLGAFLNDKAEQAAKALGAKMQSLGGAIHEHEPTAGVLHNAGEAVAENLEGSGRYLESNGFQGAARDVTNLIRHNPVPALLMGVGVGFLLARMLKRS